MAKTFAAQVNRLPGSPELKAALEYLCRESNKLYNCTVYLARQLYFKENKFSNGRWFSTQMKRNPHMKALYSSAAQQTCITVGEAFKSFKELLKLWRKGELPEKPKPPSYRTSDGLFPIGYPKRWLKRVDGQVRVPMGTACKVWFNLPEIFIPFPTNLDWSQVREKYNRCRFGLPKTHWLDAACVGETDSIDVQTLQPLSIKATGHGTRQMCGIDRDGFPIRHRSKSRFVRGFQTGDIVRAEVPKGKKAGIHVGRVAVRSTGSFNISTAKGLVQGINAKYCKHIHQKDGYSYSYGD